MPRPNHEQALGTSAFTFLSAYVRDLRERVEGVVKMRADPQPTAVRRDRIAVTPQRFLSIAHRKSDPSGLFDVEKSKSGAILLIA